MLSQSVGFIGLGRMGAGMAGCLLDAGHDVIVYNRDPGKAASLTARGASLATSPSAAASGAAAVFVMVADDTASKAVWLGPDGALAAMDEGAFAIECSTISYDWAEELANTAAARKLRYIDSPVTGLPEAAARGALTLLVGADAKDLTAAKPFLTPVCDQIVHFGDVGTGTAYKLMINLMGAVQIAATAEGLAIAEKAGLDLSQVAETLAVGQAASPQVVRHTGRMAAGDHTTNVAFTPELRLKDARYGVRMANALGLSVPFGEDACDAFQKLCNLGERDVCESKVIEVARTNLLEVGDRGQD